MSTVRIGLVGYGRGGRYFHAPLIDNAEGCALAGVVTRSAERRAELARDWPGVPAYDGLGELAADVDVVVVTTPAETHEKLVREAIARRVPVVCDKPFLPDAATARDVIATAEDAGVLLSVYQNRRWDADLLTVRAVLDSGELGEVRRFESRMEQYPPESGAFDTGGGIVLDFGSHMVDQALRLFGPARSVYAEVTAAEGGLDSGFFLTLRHRDGVTSHLIGDGDLHGAPGPRFRVTGSAGTFAMTPDDGQSERLLSGTGPAEASEAWGTVPQSRWGAVHRRGVATPVPAERGDWSVFYTRLAAAVRGEGPVPVDPRDAVAALDVLDAARVSAARGEVVRL